MSISSRLRPRVAAIVCVAGFGLAASVAAPVWGDTAGKTAKNASSVILNVVGSPGLPYTSNFNPLSPTSTLWSYCAPTMIYEPLVQYNPQRGGSTRPWLATSWAWSNDAHVLTLNLRHGVKWSDGKPFTSGDVLATFHILKSNPQTNFFGVNFPLIRSITAQGPYTVVVRFTVPSRPQFFYIAESVPIVPAHIWSHIANPATYENSHPVGTGPFVLQTSTAQYFLLMRNPHYWRAGLPKIGGLRYLAESYDSLVNLADAGQIDWAGGIDARPWVAKNPKTNHYWFPNNGVTALLPNVKQWPMSDLAVRKAVSLAIDRSLISQTASAGYHPPVESATGLLDSQSNYIAPQYKSAVLSHDPAQAKKILSADGFVMGSNGLLHDSSGRELKFTMTISTDAAGSSASVCTIMEQELKQIGIDLTCGNVSGSLFSSDLLNGNFQALYPGYSTFGNGNPYYTYANWLDYSKSAPVGQSASADFGRWQDPQTQKYLSQYASAPNAKVARDALNALEGVVVKSVPVIPVITSSDSGIYTTTHVTGWPTVSNPYANVGPVFFWSEVVALHLKPVGNG